jgi:endonuclease YncB( thermonuclease family)
MSYATRALAVASALLMGAPTAVLAHTNSIGYVGSGNGTVTFWYGNWHPGTTFTEGTMTLQGVNGTSFAPTTVNWTLIQNTMPTGLVSGTNYFMSDGTSLVPYVAGNSGCVYNSCTSYSWQGVTFTGLSAGDYQFTYNPIQYPTANWDPAHPTIKTGTVSLTSAIIAGPSAPTVTSTAAGSDIVTTSTTYGTRTETGNPHRHVMGTDANGNQTETHYTDSAVTTIPTTTVTTTTTPVTVTTWSDGSTTTTNGTPVVTSVTTDDNAGTMVVTQTNVIDWVKTRTYDISAVSSVQHTKSESGGTQKVNAYRTTTTTTTPVYTKVYTDGTPTVVTTGAATVDVAYASRDYFGRIDQLEVLDGINDGINGLLNHEPSRTKEKVRVFENNRFVQSYNADGYTADSKIFGGGIEIDLTKGWTVGFQYNQVNVVLDGVDSKSHQKKNHYGIFNTLHGNTLTLNTNAAIADSNYRYGRNVGGVFYNEGTTTGNEWWVSNRLYWHLVKGVKPFVGYTVQNVKRNAYNESGSVQSARSVDEFNQTTHVGEAGLKLETRFGGKKNNLFGVSVEGAYGTDNSYGVTAAVDYKELLIVEASHGLNNGVTNNSVAGKIKFRF